MKNDKLNQPASAERIADSLQRGVLTPCEAYIKRGQQKCGKPARYEICEPYEDPVPVCSLHQCVASTHGWPTRRRQRPKLSDRRWAERITVRNCEECGWPEPCDCEPERSAGSLERVVRSLCECVNWARAVNLKYLTNHHPDCPHYNDSLMDVWKVTVDGVSCYVDNEQDARDTAGDGEPKATINKEKMHREVFERLPEFNGF